jgi:protein TonB
VRIPARQIPSAVAADGARNAPLLVDVVVLSGDLALFEAARHAVGERNPVWRARSAEEAVDLLLTGRCGVLLIDMAAVAAEPVTLVEQLTAQFPDVVVTVAGRREDESALAALISDGLVYRFMHKPLSPKRAGMFLDAAMRCHAERRAGHGGDDWLPLARELRSRINPRTWLFAGAGMLVLLAVLAGVLLTRLGPVDGEGSAARSAGSLPSAPLADPVLSRARAALAAGRYEAPPGRNALDLYAAVLLTRPDDAEAREGLRVTIGQLLAQADRALAATDVDEAQRLAQRILKVDEGHSGARSLQATIEAGRQATAQPVPEPPAVPTAQGPVAAISGPQAAAADAPLPPLPPMPPPPETLRIDTSKLRGPVSRLPDATPGAERPATSPTTVAVVRPDPLAPRVAGGELPTSTAQRAPLVARNTTATAYQPLPTAGYVQRAAAPAPTPVANVPQRDLEPVSTPGPSYPPAAFRSRLGGWVEIEYTVSERGTTRDLTVVAAAPRGVFDEAALAAVAAWRYRPRVVNGRAVAQRTSVTLQFNVAD